jgi:hypothetical protein
MLGITKGSSFHVRGGQLPNFSLNLNAAQPAL